MSVDIAYSIVMSLDTMVTIQYIIQCNILHSNVLVVVADILVLETMNLKLFFTPFHLPE